MVFSLPSLVHIDMDKEEKSQVPVPTNDSFIIYESLAISSIMS